MKKKILAGILGLTLCVGLLTGCGTKLPSYDGNVTLGKYVGVEYTPLSTELTDAEIQDQVDYYLTQMGETSEDREGVVADGDTINLDYIGYCNGEAFEGGNTNGQGAMLTIGSHRYIDDFEEQLIGHAAGEEGVEVNVTFPDDYTTADGAISDLAGQDATFICTINYIQRIDTPEELTDELVSTYTSYTTVNSFMDALKMDYENYKKQQAENQMKADIIMAVIHDSTFNAYPEKEMTAWVDKTLDAANETAEQYGIDYETYLQYMYDEDGNPYTPETYKADTEAYVKELMEEKMVVCAIAKELGYKVTQADIDAYIASEVADNTSITAESLKEQYSTQDLAYAVVYDRVMDYLVENAVAK